MFSSTSIAMNVSKTNAFVSNDFTSRFRAMSVARGVAAPRARHAVVIESAWRRRAASDWGLSRAREGRAREGRARARASDK